jgi:Zn-dependent alcohol dehydrogenase
LKTEIKALPEAGRVEAEKVKSEAAKQAADLEKEARRQAKQLTAEGAAEAKKIKPTIEKITPLIGAGDPIVQIRKLITEGNTEKLRRAAPIIASDPAVAEAFKQAVRQEFSQLDPRTLAGGRTMRGEWETKIRPALESAGLIDAKLAKEVSERLRVAQLVMEPSAASQASIFVLRQLAAGQLGGMFGK